MAENNWQAYQIIKKTAGADMGTPVRKKGDRDDRGDDQEDREEDHGVKESG
jgi:hypothetical protein